MGAMLYHIDFVPKMLQAESVFSTLSLDGSIGGPRYETFSVVMDHLNEWLKNHPKSKPVHVEVLEVDGCYGIEGPEKTEKTASGGPTEKHSKKSEAYTYPSFLKILRLWYRKTGDSGSDVAYVHLLPARLESTPRSFCPKFQNLEVMMNAFNEKLNRREIVIDGQLLSVQTGMLRFNAQNCNLDPERMFWMINSKNDDLHICYYFTLFFCPNDESPFFHQIGYKDFAPTLIWKGQRQKLESESAKSVMEKLQTWTSSHPEMKLINIQTIDHHAYYRCARDSPGVEMSSLTNPHFRSSFKGLMQYVKVLRLFYCSCDSCCHGDGKSLDGNQAGAVIRHKSFHVERFVPLSSINFSKFLLQLPNAFHTEYLSRISGWISSSGVKVVAVETSKMCLADPRSSVSSESFVFQSSDRSKAAAVYAIRLYVESSSSNFADFKPEPRVARVQPRTCTLL